MREGPKHVKHRDGLGSFVQCPNIDDDTFDQVLNDPVAEDQRLVESILHSRISLFLEKRWPNQRSKKTATNKLDARKHPFALLRSDIDEATGKLALEVALLQAVYESRVLVDQRERYAVLLGKPGIESEDVANVLLVRLASNVKQAIIIGL